MKAMWSGINWCSASFAPTTSTKIVPPEEQLSLLDNKNGTEQRWNPMFLCRADEPGDEATIR